MHQYLLPLLLLHFLLTSATSADVDETPKPLQEWCNTTPHPHTCSHYLPSPSYSLSLPTFYKLSLEAALSRAVRARRRLRHIQNRHRDATGLSDCETLYANTVLQINRTLLSPSRTTYDFQTWLSAALTNLNMCDRNFANTPPTLTSPLSLYNVSGLISNCLAINGPLVPEKDMSESNMGYPDWVGKSERRLLGVSPEAVRLKLVVAADGSGNHRTIKRAMERALRMRKKLRRRLVVHVKAGVYRENVQVVSGLKDLMLVGDGKGRTIITGSNSVAGGHTLITSATLAVFGDGFIARDLTIRNTYGPGSQALALLLASDRSVIYRTSLEGYQDTLCTFSQRQFYRECDISGTIDFIFGNAAAVIQKSNIILRRPRKGQSNVITAQGRTDPNQNTGIVIHSCNIISSPEFWPVHRNVKTYLGRPWMKYSRTVYMRNYMSSIVHPDGWMPWSGSFALNTLYYAEFQNTGPGSRMSRRVKWPGYHVIVKPSLVRQFTVAKFIAGTMWIPATGTPFSANF